MLSVARLTSLLAAMTAAISVTVPSATASKESESAAIARDKQKLATTFGHADGARLIAPVGQLLAPGDDCTDPFTPPLAAGAPAASGDTSGAPFTAAAPACVVSHTAPGEWYTYVNLGTTNQYVVLDTEGSSFDTRLSVYRESCAALECVAGDDDSGTGSTSRVTFCAQPLVEYKVLIHGFSTATGPYVLNLDDRAACVANDLCGDAVDLAVPPASTASVSGDTVKATSDLDAPLCGVSSPDPALWYTVSGNGNGVTAATTAGSFDTKLSVYRDGCGALSCVDGDDDSGAGTLSQVTWCAESGVDYHILVHGYGTGTYTLEVTDSGTVCDGGACCRPGPICELVTERDCDAVGGTFHGIGSDCDALAEYRVEPAQSSFLDIRATGTVAPNASTGDDFPGDEDIPIGFTFPFFAVDRTLINISQNGYVTFQVPPSDFTPDPIPTVTEPNDYIAPLWGDFDPRESGEVRFETIGAAPFVVQWTDLESFPNTTHDDRNTFQVQLWPDGCIEFHYAGFTNPPIASTHVGTPYVTGIENADGSDGLGFDTTPLDFGDVPIRLCPVLLPRCVGAPEPVPNLLRNAEWPGSLKPAIFSRDDPACLPQDPAVTLDPGGADCVADAYGTPGDLEDDTHVEDFVSGDPDPQPGALLALSGPLMFYQVDLDPSVGNAVRLVKRVEPADPSGFVIIIEF